MEREPLVTNAALVGVAMAVFNIAAARWPSLEAVRVDVNTIAAFAAPFAVAFLSRRKVTPVADPRLPDVYETWHG